MALASPQPVSEFASTPTGLKPLLAIIPDHCYERSTARGLGLLARDILFYGLATWGLLSTNNPLLLVPLWIAAGISISALFVIGHDTAHNALTDCRWLNALISRVAMLPALHATEGWVFGHNRVHHAHTVKQNVDMAWHPLSPVEFLQLSRLGRLLHRVEWSPFGFGLYYMREVWWNKMVRATPPKRWRRPMRRDQALVGGAALAVLLTMVLSSGLLGLWLFVKVVVIPFVIFSHASGWAIYVHHISPQIRWWPRLDWNRFKGQIEGTTTFKSPRIVDFFSHGIMVHMPHHVDPTIPCYHLKEAAEAIKTHFPGYASERRLSVGDYLRSTKVCKLYDFEAGRWLPYPTN